MWTIINLSLSSFSWNSLYTTWELFINFNLGFTEGDMLRGKYIISYRCFTPSHFQGLFYFTLFTWTLNVSSKWVCAISTVSISFCDSTVTVNFTIGEYFGDVILKFLLCEFFYWHLDILARWVIFIKPNCRHVLMSKGHIPGVQDSSLLCVLP